MPWYSLGGHIHVYDLRCVGHRLILVRWIKYTCGVLENGPSGSVRFVQYNAYGKFDIVGYKFHYLYKYPCSSGLVLVHFALCYKPDRLSLGCCF
jgi:hypothetical protein